MPLTSRAAWLIATLIVLALFAPAALAQRQDEDQDRAEYGKNITIAEGQTSGDIACGRCSVYVRGTTTGDIAVFDGRVIVEGTVKGDIAVFMGKVRLDDNSHVGGDIAVLGGRLSRAPTASVGGDVKVMSGAWIVLPSLMLLVTFSLFVGFIVWLVTRRRTVPTVTTPTAPSG